MDVNKNSYTFLFAAIMVVVVAAVLSFTATSLQSRQAENVRKEKMQSILASINVNVSRDEAGEAYQKYITEERVLKGGEVMEGENAFNVRMEKQVAIPNDKRQAPLYIAEKDGKTYYILSLRGKGLWGPIWGYLSLKSNAQEVYGATFDHASETPGLGAEISTEEFQKQFNNKRVLDESGQFTGIQVTKKDAKGSHQVDGISGGTITSTGVENMIQDCVAAYMGYLKDYRSKVASTEEEEFESKLVNAE